MTKPAPWSWATLKKKATLSTFAHVSLVVSLGLTLLGTSTIVILRGKTVENIHIQNPAYLQSKSRIERAPFVSEELVYAAQSKSTWADGVPTILEPFHPKPGFHPYVIVCLVEKCGSSYFKHILNTTYQLSPAPGAPKGDIHTLVNPNKMFTTQELKYVMGQSDVPRVIVVRNPYTRLLSAYISKYSFNFKHQPLPQNRTYKVTFERMVRHMYTQFTEQGISYLATLDPHFRPLYLEHCGINIGYNFDHILKLEEFDDWFVEFAMIFQLKTHSISSLIEKANVPPRSDAAARNYYTPELRRYVAEMFRKDFDLLGYSIEAD